MEIRKSLPIVLIVGWTLAHGLMVAQPSPIPPGVPEPGLVLWGTVVNAANPAQAIQITSASWSVTDGSRTIVLSASSRPAVRIINQDGQSYYVAEVPFDTRTFGSLALADPAATGTPSFELKSATPPTYTFTPTINGALGTVRAIDGAPASGNAVPVPGFNSALRGKVVRVDLAITVITDPYEDWVRRHFGSPTDPRGARTADPDGDGLKNGDEFAAGTNPTDPESVLKLLTITPDSSGSKVTLGWRSAASIAYRIESAASVLGPWTQVGDPISGAEGVTQRDIPSTPGQAERFFRIRVSP